MFHIFQRLSDNIQKNSHILQKISHVFGKSSDVFEKNSDVFPFISDITSRHSDIFPRYSNNLSVSLTGLVDTPQSRKLFSAVHHEPQAPAHEQEEGEAHNHR